MRGLCPQKASLRGKVGGRPHWDKSEAGGVDHCVRSDGVL